MLKQCSEDYFQKKKIFKLMSSSSPEVVPAEGDVILQSPWPWLSRPCSCLHGNNVDNIVFCAEPGESEDGCDIGDDDHEEACLRKGGAKDKVDDMVGDDDVFEEAPEVVDNVNQEDDDDDVCPVHGKRRKSISISSSLIGEVSVRGKRPQTAPTAESLLPCGGFSFRCETGRATNAASKLVVNQRRRQRRQHREETPSPPPVLDCARFITQRKLENDATEKMSNVMAKTSNGKENLVEKMMRSLSTTNGVGEAGGGERSLGGSGAPALTPAIHEVAMRDTYYLLAKLALPLNRDSIGVKSIQSTAMGQHHGGETSEEIGIDMTKVQNLGNEDGNDVGKTGNEGGCDSGIDKDFGEKENVDKTDDGIENDIAMTNATSIKEVEKIEISVEASVHRVEQNDDLLKPSSKEEALLCIVENLNYEDTLQEEDLLNSPFKDDRAENDGKDNQGDETHPTISGGSTSKTVLCATN